MRTKTILLTAALVAAGVASSMAQSSNVYSLNVVGYVNVPVYAGYQILVNPLDDGAGDNLNSIIPSGTGNTLPDSTFLYPWNVASGTYGSIQQYIGGYGWYDPNVPSGAITNTIPPGAGFFLYSPLATNITFVGTALQGPTTNQLGRGYTLTGSTYAVSVPVGVLGDGLGSNTMQLPVVDSDFLYLFNPVPGPTHGYDIVQYLAGYGWYDPNNLNLSTNGPAPAVAQGFFTFKASASPWVQNFSVHP